MSGTYEFRGVIWPSHTKLDVPSEFRTIFDGPYEGEAILQVNDSQLIIHYEPNHYDHDLFALKGFIQRFVDGVIDTICYLTGHFMEAVVEKVVTPEGKEIMYPSEIPEATHIDESENTAEAANRITTLFGGESGTYLRLALSDYTSALSNPHDTGFFCYRAVESIRQSFCSEEDSVPDSWELMRENLGIKRENLEFIKEFSDGRRHGDVIRMNSRERRMILVFTWGFISDYIDYLDDLA